MNLLQKFEKAQVEKLTAKKEIPVFAAGDTIRVGVKIKEGERERVQNFEGVCIARTNSGLNSAFTVRKISFNEGVERIFPLYSPMLDSITVIRRGKVRRAKLYYLRALRGKKARIAEKKGFASAVKVENVEAVAPTKTAPKADAAPKAEAKKDAE
ncbi:MAG: 50S ribosomal protein L19 [Alphaproteobacteria bacterium]